MESMIARIYVLVDSHDGEIRYVGWTNKTLQRRLACHLREKHKTFHRAQWLEVLRRLTMVPIILLLQEVPLTEWATAERYWIKFFRTIGCRLTNTTDGGQGTPGKVVSAETRAKISAANAGRTRPPRSEAFRAKQRTALIGRNPMLRPDVRAKVSLMKRGQKLGPQSDEHRAKLSMAAQKCTPEKRAKLSAATKAYHERMRNAANV